MSALSDLLQRQLKIRTHNVENPLVAKADVIPTLILRSDPDRVGAVITNLSLNIIYIAPDPNVSATHAIELAPSGGFASLTWDADFELCSHAWWAIANTAGSEIFITQNIAQE